MLYLILTVSVLLGLVLFAIVRKSDRGESSDHAHDEDMWKGHSDATDDEDAK